ncbi:MAG: universal stress protein [Pseudomonadota bacterium]
MKILLPVDGSERALDAVRYALRLRSEGLNASFVLTSVQEPAFLYEVLLAPGSDVLERVSGAVGSRAMESAEAMFNAEGVAFEREIGSGDPADTIVKTAERLQCDAIIISARGLGALSGALMGSVSQAVLHASRLPVTIVKHVEGDADAGEGEAA